jgi:hypothetical protein
MVYAGGNTHKYKSNRIFLRTVKQGRPTIRSGRYSHTPGCARVVISMKYPNLRPPETFTPKISVHLELKS